MRLPRSYLFVPSDRVERYSKAFTSGADAVILDLEDAVAPLNKTGARDSLRDWLDSQVKTTFPAVWVRVNAFETKWHKDDMAALENAPIAGIVLPKAERVSELDHITTLLAPGLHVLPLIETGRGLDAMREIARGPRVQRLLFGSVDLQLDLGIQCGSTEAELAPYRAQMVLVSRLAGLAQPVDGVHTALDDPLLLADAASAAKRMGFGAKMCIHPRQIAPVNQAFTPQAEEIAWAQRVIDAVRGGNGSAVAVDGKMVDAPVVALAQRVLAQIED